MIKLGLDVDSEDIELFPSKKRAATKAATPAESKPSEKDTTDKQIVSRSPKKVNQAID